MIALELGLVGLVVGLTSGLFGVGGGFLLVPVLAFLGWHLERAIGTSLLYVTLIGMGGAVHHLRTRNVDLRFVALFAASSIAGAPAGAYLSSRLPEAQLALAFAGFMAWVAWQLGHGSAAGQREAAAPPAVPATLLLGLLVGVASGLFGVGGGVLFVPAQVTYFDIPIKRAVGNSLAGIVITGAAAMTSHALLGDVDVPAGLALVAGGLVGLAAGTRLLAHVPAARLKRAMAWFLFALALAMAWRGASAWLGPPRASV